MKKKTPLEIMDGMAETHRERGKQYGDSYHIAGCVARALHPGGVVLHTAHDHTKFQLWTQIISKLVRFAVSGLTHRDSIHDLAVYAAMLESVLTEEEKEE